MKIDFCTADGHRTRYLHEGDGPPLLLIHGIGHSADVFIRNIDVLAERFSVFAPDLPGHGFSDRLPPEAGSVHAQIVRQLERFTDSIGISEFAVCGSSYGGLLACLMALSRPAGVKRLIVVGSGGAFHDAAEQQRTLAGVLRNANTAMGAPTLASCRQRLANICFDPKSVAEEVLLTQLTSYALGDRMDAFNDIIRRYVEALDDDTARVLTRLEQIMQPTLIITGREDIRATLSSHQAAQTRMPDAELSVFEKCGHLPYMEHPDHFNQAVTEFLTRR